MELFKVRECIQGGYLDSAQMAGPLLAGAAGISAYCASKFAVRGFRGLAAPGGAPHCMLADTASRSYTSSEQASCVWSWARNTTSAVTWLRWRAGLLMDVGAGRQLLGTGVTLHMACPGFVNTPMIRDAQAAAVRTPQSCSLLQFWHLCG